MSVGKVLQTITLIIPFIELIDKWLDGDDSTDATMAIRSLPDQLQSRLALERARRRPPPQG